MENKMHKKKVIIDVAAIHKDGLKVFEPEEDIETVMYYNGSSIRKRNFLSI